MRSKQSKKALAKKLGVSRSSLYYTSKMKVRDQALKDQLLTALSEHPSYGHRRLAIHLGRNKKCVLRVMKKYGIKPYRRRVRRPRKKNDLNRDPLCVPNYAKILCPLRRNVLWASDFTYLWFRGRFWYLATVIDVFSREIVGFSFSGKHDRELILGALKDALSRNSAPIYLHSDQGSEYTSYQYLELLKEKTIKASFSDKASPWQNGFQESFYSEFKKDLGESSRFETVGEFMEALYLQVHYYNHKRIHTALKMPPAQFARQHSLPAYKLS
ncbi:MAG: IS3 family transposase [Candidatus Altimarinota bacterium]